MSAEMAFALLAGALIFGLIGSAVAGTKGNGGFGFLLGFLLGPLGVLVGILLPASVHSKACPYCKKAVLADARRCGQCGGSLVKKVLRQAVDPVDQWEARQRLGK